MYAATYVRIYLLYVADSYCLFDNLELTNQLTILCMWLHVQRYMHNHSVDTQGYIYTYSISSNPMKDLFKIYKILSHHMKLT